MYEIASRESRKHKPRSGAEGEEGAALQRT